MKVFLLITAIGTILSFIPGLITLGWFFFLVPGIFLAICPSLFVYGAVSCIVHWYLTKRQLKSYPPLQVSGKALIFTISGFAILALTLNTPVYFSIYNLIKADKEMQRAMFPVRDPLPIDSTGYYKTAKYYPAHTIALLYSLPTSGERKLPGCDALCKYLLLKKNAGMVIIGVPEQLGKIGATSAVAFANCSTNDRPCILPTAAYIDQADTYFVLDRNLGASKNVVSARWNIFANTIKATRLEAYQGERTWAGHGGRFWTRPITPTYRRTLVRARPLFIPLLFGGFEHRGIRITNALARMAISFNGPSSKWADEEFIQKEVERLFVSGEPKLEKIFKHDPEMELKFFEAVLNSRAIGQESGVAMMSVYSNFVDLQMRVPDKAETARLDERKEKLLAKVPLDDRFFSKSTWLREPLLKPQ